MLFNFPTQAALHVENLKGKLKHSKQQYLFLNVELLMRPALSLGCFCFILVGCPVGIWLSKSDFLSSFITCFLPVAVSYYPLMLCGTGQLDSLVYWLMALDVEFDVLEPPVLKERLRRASERVGRSLARGGG